MELPTIQTTARDERMNITFQIMAYRALTKSEVLQTVANFAAEQRRRRKKVQPNRVFRILTLFGAEPGL